MKKIVFLLLLSASLLSQVFGGFGRNKIHYNEFDWHIIKTNHFDVYYYPEMEDLAEKGAYEAERAYKKLSQKFNHVIKRRIPLIFYSTHIHFQQTNITPGFIPEGVGGFFEFLKGRVVIPGNGNTNQFLKVIRHEMVHVFMHAKLSWSYKQHGRFGGASPPLWYTEGLAEFYSSKWDFNGEMIMKDAVLNAYLPTISQMSRIRGSYTMYKVGENILHFIEKEYGEEKVLQLIDNMWKASKFKDVIYLTLGEKEKKLNQKWLYAQKKHYYPLLKDYDFADAVSSSVEQKGFNFKPVYYKAKNEIVFWSNRTGYTGIYKKSLANLDDDEADDVELLLTGEQSGDFESFSIFSNKMDVRKDGMLVFTSKSQGRFIINLLDLNTGQLIRNYRLNEQLVSINSPSWSPNGKAIVFSGLQSSGYRDIYSYEFETEKLNKMTDDFYEDNDPIWSPDGKSIVFSSDRTSKGSEWSYNLFKKEIDSGETSYLTFGNQQDLVPAYSPNGKYIAFVSTRNDEKNLYLIAAGNKTNAEKAIKLSNFTSTVFDFDWVSDDKIVFTVFNKGRFGLHQLDGIQAKLNADSTQKKTTFPDYADISWSLPSVEKINTVSKEKYSSDYALDFAVSQVSQDPIFGTSGGALLSISDVLGDERYNILLFNNARTSDDFLESFSFKVSRFQLGQRINYGYGIFRFTGQRYDYRSYYDEDQSGADFVLSYPLNQFNRFDFYTSVQYSDRSFFGTDHQYSWLNSSYLSYVRDNSIWSATGPIEGDRFKLSLGYTEDFVNNNISYFTFLADMRKYFRLSTRTSYAVRLMSLITRGKQSRLYAMGGSWDLRGYRFLRLRGDHLLLLSQEYRFPLLDFFGFKFSSGPAIGSNRINGAFFIDAGDAFEESIKINQIKGAFGLGVRMNMFGAFVLRWDFGYRTNFRKIEEKSFLQFFFGWDF